MKNYYPIMLDIEKKKCTVVGGGKVAEGKIKALLDYGATVTVISPEVTEALKKMEETGEIRLIARQYREGDLKGSYLVFVATDDPDVNKSCHQEAKAFNIISNVVAIPALCDFVVPAVHRQGDLTITVSTNGKSPMLSRKIKEDLKEKYGPEYKEIIKTLWEIREKARNEIKEIKDRKQLFYRLIFQSLPEGHIDIMKYQGSMWDIYNTFISKEGCKDDDEEN